MAGGPWLVTRSRELASADVDDLHHLAVDHFDVQSGVAVIRGQEEVLAVADGRTAASRRGLFLRLRRQFLPRRSIIRFGGAEIDGVHNHEVHDINHDEWLTDRRAIRGHSATGVGVVVAETNVDVRVHGVVAECSSDDRFDGRQAEADLGEVGVGPGLGGGITRRRCHGRLGWRVRLDRVLCVGRLIGHHLTWRVVVVVLEVVLADEYRPGAERCDGQSCECVECCLLHDLSFQIPICSSR